MIRKFLKWINEVLDKPDIRRIMMSVEQGAATPVLAAFGKEYEGVGGFYMEDGGLSEAMPEGAPMGAPGYKPWAFDEENEGLLWDDSRRLLGLGEE